MSKKVFISYSWDSETHQNWVIDLANKLREYGVDANVDVFFVHNETTNLNKMMVKQISDSDHVIIVLTEEYRNKVDNWNGGVGFESELLLPAISGAINKNKLIFIMRHNGEFSSVFPSQYIGYYAIDFSDESNYSLKFKELLHRIYNEPLYAKREIGTKPLLNPINHSIENEHEISSKPQNHDKDFLIVDNVKSLLQNIKSNKKIHLKQGVYNISKATNIATEHLTWEDAYDGKYPRFHDIENLHITADIGTYILIEPRYAFVFDFHSCSNLTFSGLTMGHTEAGYCVGGVLGFRNATHIKISDSVLFGCGTIGLDIQNVQNFEFSNSTIKECTYSILHIRNSNNIQFNHATFKDTEQFDLIEIEDSHNIEITDCEISNNSTSEFMPYLFKIKGDCTSILVANTKISHNEVSILSNIKPLIDFIDCEFKYNEFKIENT